MSKYHDKQQTEENEESSKDLNIKAEKVLNKKRKREKITLNNKVNNKKTEKKESLTNTKNHLKNNLNSKTKNENKKNRRKEKENYKNQQEKKAKINEVKTSNEEINKIEMGKNDDAKEKDKNIIEKNNNEISNEKNRVYINAIKSPFTEEDIRNYFKKCGKIINIHINKDTSSEKGIYIDFENQIAVNAALKKNGDMFKGEKIIISLENDIDVERTQKNIEIKLKDVKNYIDTEFTKMNNYFEIKLKATNDELEKTKKELNTTKKELNTTKSELNEAKNEFGEEIKNLKIKLGLTNAIIKQTESYNNERHEYLNSKINILLNAFKILYIRKVSNLLLEKLLTKYNGYFAKTKKIFGGKIKFCIIIADKDIEEIPKNKINLLIDFLKHVKKIASQIIHFNNLKKIKVQKEVFYELLDIYSSKKQQNDNPGLIETDDIINILCNKKDESNEEETSENEIITKLEVKINEYIEAQNNMNNESDKKSSLIEGESNANAEEENEQEENDESQNKEESDEKINKNFEDIFDEEKLNNIMLGNERESNLRISDLLKSLKDKIILNKKNKKLNKLKINEITPTFFYESWKKSFFILDYKKDEIFKKYVDLNKSNISLEEIGEIIKQLLNQEQFFFFRKDPDDFENLVKREIE